MEVWTVKSGFSLKLCLFQAITKGVVVSFTVVAILTASDHDTVLPRNFRSTPIEQLNGYIALYKDEVMYKS